LKKKTRTICHSRTNCSGWVS